MSDSQKHGVKPESGGRVWVSEHEGAMRLGVNEDSVLVTADEARAIAAFLNEASIRALQAS